MKKYLFVLVTIGFGIILPSCNNTRQKDDATKLNELINVEHQDNCLALSTLESEIYKDSVSSIEDYALLFKYILQHKTDEFDDNISHKVFEMFNEFPNKYSEMEQYSNLLSNDDKCKVNDYIAFAICHNFTSQAASTDSISFSELKAAFPEFADSAFMKYFYSQCVKNE